MNGKCEANTGCVSRHSVSVDRYPDYGNETIVPARVRAPAGSHYERSHAMGPELCMFLSLTFFLVNAWYLHYLGCRPTRKTRSRLFVKTLRYTQWVSFVLLATEFILCWDNEISLTIPPPTNEVTSCDLGRVYQKTPVLQTPLFLCGADRQWWCYC